jgi:hypothetical protein
MSLSLGIKPPSCESTPVSQSPSPVVKGPTSAFGPARWRDCCPTGDEWPEALVSGKPVALRELWPPLPETAFIPLTARAMLPVLMFSQAAVA